LPECEGSSVDGKGKSVWSEWDGCEGIVTNLNGENSTLNGKMDRHMGKVSQPSVILLLMYE